MPPCMPFDSASGVRVTECTLLQAEINSLLEKKAIKHARGAIGFYAQVFLIPRTNGKQFPVPNMEPLNEFIITQGFKMAS